MTSLRTNLKQGRAVLVDSFGNVAAEWHDKTYARAIKRGECCVERWHRMFHKLAVERGYIIATEGGFIARDHQT